MHLVLSVVAEFVRKVPPNVQREDLIAAGSMGLFQALRSQTHTCPAMLAAYARIRIRGAVIDELRRHDWSPRRRRPQTTALPTVLAPGEAARVAEERPPVVVIGFDDLPPEHGFRGEDPSPLEQLEERRSSRDVRGAIAKLADRERTVITMRYFEDTHGRAIASTLGLSEARVSQLLTRAKTQLRALLGAGAALDSAA